MQHDAEECLQSFLYAADTVVDQLPNSEGAGAGAVQQLFGIHMDTKSRCLDVPSEAETTDIEHVLMLKVHIDGKTNFLKEGLQFTMLEQLEKDSIVGPDAEMLVGDLLRGQSK